MSFFFPPAISNEERKRERGGRQRTDKWTGDANGPARLAVDWLGVGSGTCTLLLASPARRSHRDRPRNSGSSSRYGRRAELRTAAGPQPCSTCLFVYLQENSGCILITGRLTMLWSCDRPRSLPISWPSRTFSRAQRAGACDDEDSAASARGRHGGAFAGPTTRLRARADHHYAWRRLRPAHREDAACD